MEQCGLHLLLLNRQGFTLEARLALLKKYIYCVCAIPTTESTASLIVSSYFICLSYLLHHCVYLCIHAGHDGLKCVTILEHLLLPRSLKVKTTILHYSKVNVIPY